MIMDHAQRALLPAGLRDTLPPEAAFEARVTEGLAAFFASNGYDRVTPPLVEFEETLLSGSGAATAAQVFRFMDPMSQRMMGVRADITSQVARIAVTRLVKAPRPLRLGYAGHVLRVKGSQLRPERQSIQAGVELIGSPRAEADTEVILLVAEALADLGVTGVSVDLNLPTLVPAVLAGLGVKGAEEERLRRALYHKDSTALAAEDGLAASLLVKLVTACCGPADRAVGALAVLDLPPVAASERDVFSQVVRLVRTAAPALTITIDPVEHCGFEYHAGVSFTIFARGAQGELGRGGRYRVVGNGKVAEEVAVGATLFVDAVLEVLPPQAAAASRRLLVPHGTTRATVRSLQAADWITVVALEPEENIVVLATRLGCSHVLFGNRIVARVLL